MNAIPNREHGPIRLATERYIRHGEPDLSLIRQLADHLDRVEGLVIALLKDKLDRMEGGRDA